ncbi:MAG: hypothetical protein MUC94_07780, partial [bacterium]|nr:hypothetical protein [bacterium]
MKRFVFLTVMISLLVGTFGFSQDARLFMGDRARLQDDIQSFVGYVPDAIVVKFDPSVVKGFNKTLFSLGKTGNKAIDAVNQKYGANVLEEMFPNANAKSYNGRQIELNGYVRIKFAAQRNDIEKVASEYG